VIHGEALKNGLLKHRNHGVNLDMVFHLPPHELQETPQANNVTLRRDRGRDKAAGLRWQYEKDSR